MTDEERAALAASVARPRKRRKAGGVVPSPDPASAVVLEEEEHFDELRIVPGVADEDLGVADDDKPSIDSPYYRFLDRLDAETRELFDEDELRGIFEEQQKKARAERRAEAKKAATERALTEARIAEGVIRPETAEEIAWHRRMEEPVYLTIDMPGLGEDGIVDIGMRVDQKIFLHGVRYRMTRGQYESIRWALYNARQNELLFEGKDRRHWLRRQATGRVNGYIDLGEEAAAA